MITLGLDIGTASVKAVLLGDGDQVIASAGRPLTVSRPQSGLSEQGPQHGWQAVCGALDELQALTGTLAMPGFTAHKLMWVAEHEPALFARIAHVLLPKAYVNWRLCGQMADEMSDASGTLWLDVAGRDWSAAALHAQRHRQWQALYPALSGFARA